MENLEEQNELTLDYDQLKILANRTSNWRERLAAVEELGKLEDNQQVVDVLTHRMNNDSVFTIQEAAYRALRKLGEDVQMPAKKKGDPFKGSNKILLRIKKSLPKDHSLEEFGEKFKKMRIDMYDTYEGQKGDEFAKWLEDTWNALTIR
ncbi:HEAT repeat domain-containing protein [Paenibacillus sp. GSMTC-2017]|uniref:HEAT repeat domain-containing protein n=1 Tax=Paenibacillus sp. GSMTC-2017 TaxID=2794350 RepID=UPI0018D7E469|nr:HEAT repeat domain-containing protein [Paenibacillus sp. GSMTC-2017]MBH5319044.1 HEAT repeat domain-containing protein [Paenibacillus sp. GSMTC-2017]